MHSLIMWHTVSSRTPHNLHNLVLKCIMDKKKISSNLIEKERDFFVRYLILPEVPVV